MTITTTTRETRHEIAAKIVATYSAEELRKCAQRAHGMIAIYELSTQGLKEVVIDALVENYRQNPLSLEWDLKQLKSTSPK